jgi:8-oxo-dGTP pyrophosphatase MutT (NUDIX family)
VLLVEHSYRRRGAWGLPGGALDSIPGDPIHPHDSASPDNILEATLQREISEELGIDVKVLRLLRTDAVPYVAEEPGPYRLTFYFRCEPAGGFAAFRRDLDAGAIRPRSAEILQLRLVPLDSLNDFDLFSPDARFLRADLPRLLDESRRDNAGGLP